VQSVVDTIFVEGEPAVSVVRRWFSGETQVAIRVENLIFLQFHRNRPRLHPMQANQRFFEKYNDAWRIYDW
jgi:hypothetical protein